MNILKVIREINTPKSCIGHWYFNDKALNLFSLEDTDRGINNLMGAGIIHGIKIQNETAIGVGEFPLVINYSPKFKANMLLIDRVIGFNGVRIHVLNKAEESDACIGVGTTYDSKVPDFIGNSREGYKQLLNVLAPIMGFKTKTDKKNNTSIILPVNYIQKEPVKLVITRTYAI